MAKHIVLTGTVERIEESERNDGSITIRHGERPKKDKEGMTVGPFPPTTHFNVPRGKLREFKIGDRVEIEIRKAGKHNTLHELRTRRGK